MENASKALLIAGSILIALITIAVLVRSFTNISEFQMSKLSEEEQEQLIAFNEQYTKYLNQYVYGTEVASLKNRYENDKIVEVKVLPDDTAVPTGIGEQTKYYKCIGITYDNSTGRVNTITFQKIEVTPP